MNTTQRIFDILRLQSDGSELYISEAASYSIALIDIEILATKVPAKYIIRDRETGQAHVVNLLSLDIRILGSSPEPSSDPNGDNQF